ncbi:PLDc N-terminal domain-containing protein [Patescibacteria group bacterium]|nr:PLDc N-terminal domain-containing protein [Patescibacteria group bacterium]
MVEVILGGIIGLVCAIWVIYDVFANNKKLDTGMKVLWTVLAIFFSIITAIVYYFMYKNKKKK